MEDEIIKDVGQFLGNESLGEDKAYFSDSRYEAHVLSKKNFHMIGDGDPDKKICFIDGGNQEIIKAANFS